jgi:hypothetical protein
MAAVLFVAVILAVRDWLATLRRQRIKAEIERLARALAEYRHKYGSGWQCRVILPVEVGVPEPQAKPGSSTEAVDSGLECTTSLLPRPPG